MHNNIISSFPCLNCKYENDRCLDEKICNICPLLERHVLESYNQMNNTRNNSDISATHNNPNWGKSRLGFLRDKRNA